jgi:enamine deaminase RidA (YjgF/YER057c/UK114 family)
MAFQYLSPSDVGPTFGRYNKGLRAGNRIFLSGQVPWDGDGNVVGAGDVDVQAKQVFRNMGRILEEGGGSFTDIAMTRTYTTNVLHRPVIGDTRRANGLTESTNTLAVVNSLVEPAFALEISGVAYVDTPLERISPETVHRTVGTYVHAVRANETLYVAGQIALDRDGNLVGPGDIETQAEQTAQNLVRVLEAGGASPDSVVYLMIYVTNPLFIDAVRAARRKHGLAGCASTLIVIPSLAQAEFLVEIEAIAVVGAEKQVIRPEDVHDVSARYEHAVRFGDTLYLSGQVSADLDGNLVGPGDASAQARQLYDNMGKVLKAAGTSFADVVNTTTYMTNVQHRPKVNEVRTASGLSHATNTSVVISALASPGYLLEVEAIAVLGD